MNKSIMAIRKPFKRGNFWYYEINRKRVSLKTKDKAKALRIFNEIKREYLAGRLKQLTKEKSVSLGDFAAEYLEWAETTQIYKTFRANRLALNKILAIESASKRLDQLSPKTIDKLIAQSRKKKLKPASINNYISHARMVMNKAVEWKYVKENPFASCKLVKKTRRPPAFLSPEQCTEFLASVADTELKKLIISYLFTGRRREELFNLEWADIDFERNSYLIRRSKTHLSKHYPMHPAFREVLESYEDRTGRVFKKWLHIDTISKHVKQALINAGFENFRLHDLRHTFASNLAEAGESLHSIGELLGHTDKRTTEIYAHLSSGHLTQSIQKLTYQPE